jgi:hypothetical protein
VIGTLSGGVFDATDGQNGTGITVTGGSPARAHRHDRKCRRPGLPLDRHQQRHAHRHGDQALPSFETHRCAMLLSLHVR